MKQWFNSNAEILTLGNNASGAIRWLSTLHTGM